MDDTTPLLILLRRILTFYLPVLLLCLSCLSRACANASPAGEAFAGEAFAGEAFADAAFADAAYQEGCRLMSLQTAVGYQASVQSFLKAAPLYSNCGKKKEQASCLAWVGLIYRKVGQPRKALEYYATALPLEQEAGDKQGEAAVLTNMGRVYEATGQPQKGLEYYEKALPLTQEAQDQQGEAAVLNNIGTVYRDIGQPQKALEYYKRALPLEQEAHDRQGEAAVLNNIGAVYNQTGQLQGALEYYGKALALEQEARDKQGETSTLNNIGAVYRGLGQPQKALEYYAKALLLKRELGDRQGEATVLTNIGEVCGTMGQPLKALEFYEKALLLKRETQDKRGEAAVLTSIGVVYHHIGEPQKALEYDESALPLEQEVEDRSGEATVLNNMGEVYRGVGQPQKALGFYLKALSLLKEAQDKSAGAIVLRNVGEVCRMMGKPQKALEFYTKALFLDRDVRDKQGEAGALNDIGAVYREAGQLRKALEFYAKALPLLQEVGDKEGEATVLTNTGAICADLSQLSMALEYYEKALVLLQEVGDKAGAAINLANTAFVLDKLGRKQEARAGYDRALIQLDAIMGSISRDELKRSATESYQWIYQVYIDFLLREGGDGDTGKALEVSEMARSRALRDILAGNTSQLPSQMIFPKAQGEASAGVVASAPPHTTGSPAFPRVRRTGGQAVPGLVPAAARALEDLPPLASPGQAEPFQLKEAAEAAADGPVVLYHILSNDLAIFVVGQSGEIHAARSSVQPLDLLKLIQEARTAITANDDPTETKANLRKLYNVLLKPVEPWITSNPEQFISQQSTLTLVPFGPLFQVPFGALIGPDGRYLIQRCALRTAPSLTVLRFTRRRSATLEQAPMRSALYGDPVMPAGWADLHGAMEEVKQVASTMAAARTVIHTRGAATELAFRAEAPKATEIHVATHGFINSMQPLYSGIVLSSSDGSEPPYQRDGFLTVGEVFRLKLNARLVTLSACDTGLGATNSDGVFGFQSAFLSAGSASLLSTLWCVNDEAASRLMQEFYRRMHADPLHDRVRAIQGAQLWLLSSRKFRAPVYWASFVLTGEAR